ncbi:MAG: hypothetical protein ABIB11_04245 [Candidatus Omnitrophota bacterium]
MNKIKISEKNRYGLKGRSFDSCLSQEELSLFVTAILDHNLVSRKHKEHIVRCDKCFSTVASAIATFNSYESADVYDDKLRESIEKLPSKYPKQGGLLKKHKYLLVTGVCFILSFFLKRYFMQCLFAALLFGFKWVMDTGGSKALVMIYDAWKSKKQNEVERDRSTRF